MTDRQAAYHKIDEQKVSLMRASSMPKLKDDPHCDYCGNPAQLLTGRQVYPGRTYLYELPFWCCFPCKAYVGCHKGTLKPLGTLANEALRQARSAAHEAFDPIWKEGHMRRNQAYVWLSQQLHISITATHIAMLNVEQCNQVVLASEQYFKEVA